MSSRYKWCAWWYEVDKFDGKETRHYRDFKNSTAALRFKRMKDNAHYAPIANCPWHHQHAEGKAVK